MQTSIGWLIEELRQLAHNDKHHLGMGDIRITQGMLDDFYEQAKEIHKQEIVDAKDGLYQDTSHRGYTRPDDIDKFEQDAWDNYEHVEGNLYSTTFRNAFKLGYNKAKEILYTEEQVNQKMIDFAQWCRTHNKLNDENLLIEQLFSEYKSIKQ
jgi:hypothetical protein